MSKEITQLDHKILEHMPGGVFIYKYSDGQIIYANQNLIDLLGCETFDDLLDYTGGVYANVMHKDDRQNMKDSISQQMMDNKDLKDHLQYRVIAKDGSVRLVEDFGQMVHDPEFGDVFYIFVVDRDPGKLDMELDPTTGLPKQHMHGVSKEKTRELEIRHYVTEHIDDAIANGEIVVYYQPVVRTLSRSLCGFEALARWNSSEFGFLAPYQFIPALEDSHQIYKLDCEILRGICHQYKEMTDMGKEPVPVSFNLSQQDFQHEDMVAYVLNTTREYNVPHSMIRIEITESTLASDDAVIMDAIARFHEAGFDVWMDDFGSGYSSLNTLKDYHFDKLKIDMVFLSTFSEKAKSIITSIVQMAKKIGIHTLAEGVETAEQFEFLRGIGCEEVQGYYFGKPLSMDTGLSMIAEKGIGPESRIDAGYYGQAGMIDMDPDEPFAILEDNGERFKFVYLNHEFMRVVEKLGGRSPEFTLKQINRKGSDTSEYFRSRLMQAEKQGGYISFAYSFDSNYVTLSLEILSKREGQQLVKMSLSKTVVEMMDRTEKQEPAKVEVNEDESLSTVLVVDDEPINLMMMGEILRGHYHVLFAENGAKALQMIEDSQEGVSAVLLDMVMPVMDGMEVLRTIRSNEATRFLPVLAMTSATNLQEQLLQEGANQFLPKPFEAPELIRAKIANVITSTDSLLRVKTAE